MQTEAKLSYVGKLRLFKKDARFYIASGGTRAFAWGMSNVVFNLYLLRIPGVEEDFLGFFLSMSMFAMAAMGVLAGMASDRWCRKNMLLVFSTVANIATAIQYITINTIGLIATQIVLGLSFAFQQVAWTPYITDLSTSQERAHLFGFSSGISLLTIFFGNLIGGFLPGVFDTLFSLGGNILTAYRFTLWVSLIPLFTGTLLIIPMSRDRPTPRKFKFGFANVKNARFIGQYTAVVSIVGLGAGMIVMFFNVFFEAVFSADSALIGVIFAINTILLSSGNFLAPALADRIGKVRTIVVTEALSIPFLLMLWWSPNIYIGVLGYVSRNVLMNMAGPVNNAFYMEGLAKGERATAMGITSTGDSLVRAIAANIGGLLLAAGLYREPYLLVSGLYILGIILFFAFFRNKEREISLVQLADITRGDEANVSPDIT
ncbi:MAG: MFS transporter [Candidatus Thorarchaeota archaeon]|nr:MAG: MFS transporter [Candidatus Thorarchaeota archaeon]